MVATIATKISPSLAISANAIFFNNVDDVPPPLSPVCLEHIYITPNKA